MKNPATISFIIPTRGRPESLPRLCDSIRKNTLHPEELEIVFVMDSDDTESLAFRYPDLNIRIVELPHGRTMAELNNEGYRATTGQYIMLMNDDVVISTHGWDEIVLDIFRSYPDGMVLVHLDEAIFHQALCTFPFLTRRFIDLAGGIAPNAYRRYRIDDHIHNVFDLLYQLGYHRRIYVPGVVFPHHNLTQTETGIHEYVPDPEIHRLDTQLFDALLPERKRLAKAAVALIEEHARSGMAMVREKRLELIHDSVAIRNPNFARWYPPLTDPQGQPRVTIGVVSADIHSEHASKCIRLLKQHTCNFELIIIDNNGAPGFNHSAEMNRLLSLCRTDYLALLDDDVFVEEGWLEGLLRAMEPGVGVATPLHKDRNGQFSYAGVVMQPDDSGHHTHYMQYGDRPHNIQTLCSAAMLIDVNRCRQIQLDETYIKYFLDIDYGLRVWEAGWRVVCSPWSSVTHIGGGTLVQGSDLSNHLFEEQRQHFVREWVETRRLHALRRSAWSGIAEFRELARISREVESLFSKDRLSKDAYYAVARSVVEDLAPVPAFRNQLMQRVREAAPDPALLDCDDPQYGKLSILVGLTGIPVLYERNCHGLNIVLWNSRLYAIPGTEGAFDPNGQYSRRYESSSAEQLRRLIVEGKDLPPVTVKNGAAPPPPPLLHPAEELPALPPIGPSVRRILGTAPHLSVLRDLTVLFDRAYYLKQNPDIAKAGVNPLMHYVFTGGFEGRQPHPMFDSTYYLRRYPDVAAAQINPLVHYLRHGAAEGRQPHPNFDPVFYLEVNPDVRKRGINPLIHYIQEGAAEGRRTHPQLER